MADLERFSTRRTYLSTEQPYRAGPKAAETGPKTAPEEPFKMVPERLVFRVSSGTVSPALGPAL